MTANFRIFLEREEGKFSAPLVIQIKQTTQNQLSLRCGLTIFRWGWIIPCCYYFVRAERFYCYHASDQWNSLESQAVWWKARGIATEECLATGQDQPLTVWETLNRLRPAQTIERTRYSRRTDKKKNASDILCAVVCKQQLCSASPHMNIHPHNACVHSKTIMKKIECGTKKITCTAKNRGVD